MFIASGKFGSGTHSAVVLAAPVKIFGDLHGQFLDLMRLFDEYGAPSTAGDITYIDYLFLGDYVDRGAHSLETICLLLALKIEHPKAVHLIRGNHEVRCHTYAGALRHSYRLPLLGGDKWTGGRTPKRPSSCCWRSQLSIELRRSCGA